METFKEIITYLDNVLSDHKWIKWCIIACVVAFILMIVVSMITSLLAVFAFTDFMGKIQM